MKKRYTNESQITAEIDRQKQRAVDLLGEAESLEATARELFKLPGMVEDASMKKEMAKALRRASARIIDRKLVKLKEQLGTFQTEPMPFLDGDRSIPVKAA